jgi:hypothetical protein
MRHRMVALWASQCLCRGEDQRRWRHSTMTISAPRTAAAITAAVPTRAAASPMAMWSSSAGAAIAARATGCGLTATVKSHRTAMTAPSQAAWQPCSSVVAKTMATLFLQCEALSTCAAETLSARSAVANAPQVACAAVADQICTCPAACAAGTQDRLLQSGPS